VQSDSQSFVAHMSSRCQLMGHRQLTPLHVWERRPEDPLLLQHWLLDRVLRAPLDAVCQLA
jgi:hypothetical protein